MLLTQFLLNRCYTPFMRIYSIGSNSRAILTQTLPYAWCLYFLSSQMKDIIIYHALQLTKSGQHNVALLYLRYSQLVEAVGTCTLQERLGLFSSNRQWCECIMHAIQIGDTEYRRQWQRVHICERVGIQNALLD